MAEGSHDRETNFSKTFVNLLLGPCFLFCHTTPRVRGSPSLVFDGSVGSYEYLMWSLPAGLLLAYLDKNSLLVLECGKPCRKALQELPLHANRHIVHVSLGP